MSKDTAVTLYYGPLAWFHEIVGARKKSEGLLEAVYARDEESREIRIVQKNEGESGERKPKRKRRNRLVAESGDYASLKEHAITNFSALVKAHNPKSLILHNPPEYVDSHLRRNFPDSFRVVRYEYPSVTRDTLLEFHDGFEQRLVGQLRAKEAILATLYPLSHPTRKKPVVAMFYGASGVGKTESAQFINDLLGGALMRKQFSMFQNDKFASYLFGGSHSEPSFAHDLLDRDSGVILIDEFDKAARVFHSAFYEFFDGGVFRDKNYRVDVGRSLVICTSNYESEAEIRDALGDALFSRFDALVRFEPLSHAEISLVADRLVEAKLKALGPEAREVLDSATVKSVVGQLIDGSSNVRRLGKLVDEVISMLLVRHLLGGRAAQLGTEIEGPSV